MKASSLGSLLARAYDEGSGICLHKVLESSWRPGEEIDSTPHRQQECLLVVQECILLTLLAAALFLKPCLVEVGLRHKNQALDRDDHLQERLQSGLCRLLMAMH